MASAATNSVVRDGAATPIQPPGAQCSGTCRLLDAVLHGFRRRVPKGCLSSYVSAFSPVLLVSLFELSFGSYQFSEHPGLIVVGGNRVGRRQVEGPCGARQRVFAGDGEEKLGAVV